jgi:hypothetical protein
MDIGIEIAGGAWIFLGAILLTLVGVIIGYYTRTGSGIAESPYGKIYGGAPGARGASNVLGKDQRQRVSDWTRGTR